MSLDESRLPQNSEPGATCLQGQLLDQYNNIDHDLCSRPESLFLIKLQYSFQSMELFITKYVDQS